MERSVLIKKLNDAGVDTQSAIDRFMGNEELFIKFIYKLPEYFKFDDILKFLENENEEQFYMAIHNLKGNAANLGITNIMECMQAILVEYRASKFTHKKKFISLLDEAKANGEILLEILKDWNK